MYDFLLDERARVIRDRAREFVKNEVEPEYLRRMDRDEIQYPRELYQKFAAHELLGLRFPRQYGGKELSWVAECIVFQSGKANIYLIGYWPTIPKRKPYGATKYRSSHWRQCTAIRAAAITSTQTTCIASFASTARRITFATMLRLISG